MATSWNSYEEENDFKYWQNRTDVYTSNRLIHTEHYQPFDDFDRELLAEADQRCWLRIPHNSSVLSDPQRSVCNALGWHHREHLDPSKRPHEGEPETQPFVHASAQRLGFSDSTSSDANVFSSPTISMLKKKQGGTNNMQYSVSESFKNEEDLQPLRSDGQRRYSNVLRAGVEQTQSQDMPEVRGISLVPTSRLSDIQRSMFQFKWFNAVQSKCFTTAYETDENLVVSAPTGSGKTVIMELAMLRLIDDMGKGNVKVVYLAPTKSLCNERCLDWHRKFNIFGIHCAELTGDTDYNDMQIAQRASVIVTTPEKWDSMTRKWKNHSKLITLIKLLLMDEIHVLGDARGATVEAIVSRMKCATSNTRFVALSATIPNSDDIAKWLTRTAQDRHLPAIREVFDESFRPVKLTKHILASDGPYNPWAFDNILTEKLPSIVARYSRGKPVMIFCSTKDSAQRAAIILAETQRSPNNSQLRRDSTRAQPAVVNDMLRKVLQAGVAFHHASLTLADRKVVEQGFLHGNVNIICSTSTLAVGVNLPCYLVILKGTHGYGDNGLREYSNLEVMQMLGRAGRPQFEREACAVILCHKQHQNKYENMIAGEENIESSLHRNLIEHLNAEISVGTIHSLASANQWLQSTFLYVRIQRNAGFYGMDPDKRYRNLEEALLAWCEKNLKLLRDATLVENSSGFRCTEYGNGMAKYCVKFDTMRKFMSLPAKAKIPDILKALSSAAEFHGMRMKSRERKVYKEINKANETRFPIDVDIALPQHKISLIIQSKLGGVDISKTRKLCNSEKEEPLAGAVRQLQADTHCVFDHCKRLIRCLVDILLQGTDSVAIKNALEMARSLAAQAWDDTFLQLKQIQGIGDVFARKLAASGIKSVNTLFSTEAHRIEIILSKSPPFGYNILEKATSFPLLHVSIKELRKKHIRERGVEIKIQCEISFVSESPPLFFNRKGFKVLFLCETSSGTLIDFRCFPARQLQIKQEFVLAVTLQELTSSLRCHTMCDDVAGTHCYAELLLNCPDFWYPVKQTAPVLNEKSTSNNTTAVDRGKWEELDDEGVDDTTLLHAAQACSVEVSQGIYDIDDILEQPSEKVPVNNGRKRRGSSSTPSDIDNPPTAARLPNGNWACRHSCRDKKLECKHVCCKEGVKKKPSTKRRKKQLTSKDSTSEERRKSTSKNSLKHTKADSKIEDFFMDSNAKSKEEFSNGKTSSSRNVVVERSYARPADLLLPSTTPIEDEAFETASSNANNTGAVTRPGKLAEDTRSYAEIIAAGVGNQHSSSKVILDSKKNLKDDPKEKVSASQSSCRDQKAFDTALPNQDAYTNGREGLRYANALKEVRSQRTNPDLSLVENETGVREAGVYSGRNTKSEASHSSFHCFDLSQTSADEDQSNETEENRSNLEQHRPKTSLTPAEIDLEQKRCWDDLENDFLTYNNFSFVSVVPD